jgi:hypothetical protein
MIQVGDPGNICQHVDISSGHAKPFVFLGHGDFCFGRLLNDIPDRHTANVVPGIGAIDNGSFIRSVPRLTRVTSSANNCAEQGHFSSSNFHLKSGVKYTRFCVPIFSISQRLENTIKYNFVISGAKTQTLFSLQMS